MNVQEMIARLIELGMSQGSIAELCGTTQPTISRAAKGTTGVGYELGKSIESLLAKMERANKRKSPAAA